MNPTLTLATTLTLLLTLVPTIHADHESTCKNSHKTHYSMINSFCSNGIVSPSDHANTGLHNGGSFIAVRNGAVEANGQRGPACNPPQWIPQYWCRQQFYTLCAGNYWGGASANFGNNGCQNFWLE
ncbi:hypothetical protein BDV97DRAFT_349966 [Delphinella strobiligena]|nr:hypothetical protein BDV97DRAFT_349966 [Delphinella strobiligena]